MAQFDWRPMVEADLDGVVSVAAAAFPDHFEQPACFEERLALFPGGCFVLASADVVKGYVIAYPWPLGTIPPLGGLLGRLPEAPGALYLHDLALHPVVRGRRLARPIVERLVADAIASGVGTIALVAVNGTVPFWRNLGFEPVPQDAAIARKLQSYGDASAYMIRELEGSGRPGTK